MKMSVSSVKVFTRSINNFILHTVHSHYIHFFSTKYIKRNGGEEEDEERKKEMHIDNDGNNNNNEGGDG